MENMEESACHSQEPMNEKEQEVLNQDQAVLHTIMDNFVNTFIFYSLFKL